MFCIIKGSLYTHTHTQDNMNECKRKSIEKSLTQIDPNIRPLFFCFHSKSTCALDKQSIALLAVKIIFFFNSF